MAKLLHISSLALADEQAILSLGYEVDKTLFKRGKKFDELIASPFAPLSPNAELVIIIACSKSDEIKEEREAYYMLPPSVKTLDSGGGALVPASATSQVAKYASAFSPLVSFTCEDKDFVPLLCYESGEAVAFRYHSLIVIPNIENKSEIITILKAAIKDKTARREIKPEAGSKTEKLLLKKRDVEDKYRNTISLLEKEIEEASFLSGLSSSHLETFSSASLSFFKFLGFQVKEALSRGYLLSLNDRLFFLYPELSATASISTLPASRQLSRLKKKVEGKEIKLIIACGEEMFLPPECRKEPLIALPEEAVAVSASSMISFYENAMRGVLKKEDALDEISGGGLLTFLPKDERAITRIDKVAKNNEKLSRATLEGRAIKKGMRVIVKDKRGRLKSARIMNIKVGSVYLTDAVEGVVTLETDIPLSLGDFLFSSR